MLIGRKPVEEALISGRGIEKVLVLQQGEGSLKKMIAIAHSRDITVVKTEKSILDKKAEGANHQGIIAYVADFEYARLDDIFEKAEKQGEKPFIVILDEIEDPHNLGAIMRSAEVLGAHGMIIPKRRAAQITDIVAKTAAGAAEHMLVVRESNLAQTIEELKRRNVWIYACDMGSKAYYDEDLTGSLAIVIGNEGSGIGRLVKEKSDFIISIPMYGNINSLNASNAAAIVMSEVAKQRHA